jgi:hypothetical protein
MRSIFATLSCALLGLMLLVGCQSAGNSSMTNPGRVVILFGKPPKSYVEVGTVSTPKTQPNPGDTWQSALQKQAAGLGADAVLVDTSTLDNNTTPMVTGRAIRYQ